MHILWSLTLAVAALADVNPPKKFSWSCESFLAPVPDGAREVFADRVQLPSTGDIFVRIEAPRGAPPKKWILAVHGLLDSHRAYDDLTPRLLAAGYGVVRPDLAGFARSLRDHHRHEPRLDYRENVRDLAELITLLRERFHVFEPRVIGHSMGGGLTLALLAYPGVAERVDPRHVIINPYVYRNENYVAKKMHLSTLAHLEPWIPDALKFFPQIVADSLISPQMRYAFGTYLRTARQTRDLDFNQYRVRQALDEQVEVAITVVKGLRRLNSLHELDRIPKTTQVDMIFGDRDEVVEPPLARELARRIRHRGGQALEIRAEHHIPITNIDALLALIID